MEKILKKRASIPMIFGSKEYCKDIKKILEVNFKGRFPDFSEEDITYSVPGTVYITDPAGFIRPIDILVATNLKESGFGNFYAYLDFRVICPFDLGDPVTIRHSGTRHRITDVRYEYGKITYELDFDRTLDWKPEELY